MVPHLANRPVTFRRFPDGVAARPSSKSSVPRHAPEWVQSMNVHSPSGRKGRDTIDYPLIGDRPSLVWAANLAALELHVPLWHREGKQTPPTDPDHLVFDLDPGPETTIVECCRIALLVARPAVERQRRGRQDQRLEGPPGLRADARRESGTTSATRCSGSRRSSRSAIPTTLSAHRTRSCDQGKVLIDWSQNHPAKTTVAVYSLRATPYPTASTPVTWDEVAKCAKSGDPAQLRFRRHRCARAARQHGDLFAPLLAAKPRKKQAARKP